MVEPLLVQGRQVGPASRTFYPSFTYGSGIDSSSQFREQLSDAYSHTYLLTRHAVVNSYFDCAPLTDYHDVRAYDEAASLYLNNVTPRDDLIFAKWSVYRARLINQRYRTQTCQLVRVLKEQNSYNFKQFQLKDLYFTILRLHRWSIKVIIARCLTY